MVNPMVIYNKLVRDKVPSCIEAEGKICYTKNMDGQEYIMALEEKLIEEVNEYLQSHNIMELVDVVEVIYGIVASMGVDKKEFELYRLKKLSDRGGFNDKIMLLEVVSS